MAGPKALSKIDAGMLPVTEVGPGVDGTDAAQLAQAQQLAQTAETNARTYTDAQIAGLTSGQTPKGTVRAAATTNINIAAPGSTIDGLTPDVGQVFLLTAQSTGNQNGPHRYNGPSTPMTRATNWDTQEEAVLGSYWTVNEGSLGDTFALLTNDAYTLGTTTATFKFVGIAAQAEQRGMSETSPTTPAGGTWTITHGLSVTKPPTVQVWRNNGQGDLVSVAARCPSPYTQVTVAPDVAFAAGEFLAVINKAV